MGQGVRCRVRWGVGRWAAGGGGGRERAAGSAACSKWASAPASLCRTTCRTSASPASTSPPRCWRGARNRVRDMGCAMSRRCTRWTPSRPRSRTAGSTSRWRCSWLPWSRTRASCCRDAPRGAPGRAHPVRQSLRRRAGSALVDRAGAGAGVARAGLASRFRHRRAVRARTSGPRAEHRPVPPFGLFTLARLAQLGMVAARRDRGSALDLRPSDTVATCCSREAGARAFEDKAGWISRCSVSGGSRPRCIGDRRAVLAWRRAAAQAPAQLADGHAAGGSPVQAARSTGCTTWSAGHHHPDHHLRRAPAGCRCCGATTPGATRCPAAPATTPSWRSPGP